MTTISDNVSRVRERMIAAASRTGRDPAAIALVAVTKTFDAAVIREVVGAGVLDIGENRVQELLAKQDVLEDLACRWHLVGPLQRNKAGKIVGRVELVHAIDSVRIAQTLDRVAGERGVRMRVLLEVNTSGETSKHGVGPDGARPAAEALCHCEWLDWDGLMTIGPLENGDTRACFRLLARLSQELRAATGKKLPILSMGMSDDFEVAIEEGSTMIRLGRCITGERR
ncbi:MAG TPA: YggS family pyridoxal phosphate-dependent enzyme [Candidatus Krumholzibacteria bacterium]|nr:YggS family pyridoxal phosphate-dependent enzyme [Candidatus Krumholzibacteria bacterium]